MSRARCWRTRVDRSAGPTTAVEGSDGLFLLQAFAKEKDAGPLHEQVPVDQCMLREGAASCQLYLPPGTYTTRAVNPAGKALPGWSQTLAVE